MRRKVHLEHIQTKHRTKATFNFKPILLGLLIVFLLIPIGYFGYNAWQTQGGTNIMPQPTPIPTPKFVQVARYFVPVSKFTNTKTNYLLSELAAGEFISLQENEQIVPENFKIKFVADEAALMTELNQDKIALLTPEQVSPKYKTILIDGVNFWAGEPDPDSYPFAKIEMLPETPELVTSNYTATKTIKVFAGGEIIPARAVDRLSLNKNNNYTYLFDFFKTDIATADLALSMLENPLNGDPKPCTGCTTFVSDARVAKGFADIGFDFIAASGNHMGDGGQNGYPSTHKLLAESNLQFTGSGKGDAELLKPAITDINGFRIGMLSADDIAYFYWNTSGKGYGTNNFSKVSNGITTVDKDRVKKITAVKADNKIDYLIIYESWGVEYTNKATKHQEELAHLLVDSGADLIVASHPHWVQNIEFYKDTPILYALGNFIFDQTHTLPTRQGANVNLYFYQNKLRSIEIMPHQTCGYHQTKNDLTNKYLNREITMEQVYNTAEKDGCVYWQPKKLTEASPAYKEILNRIFQHTKVN